MQSNNLMTLQNLMKKLRNDLTEEIGTPEGNLEIKIDGNFKFCQLTIKKNTPNEYIEEELPKLFNVAFENMAQKMKVEIEQHSAKLHLN